MVTAKNLDEMKKALSMLQLMMQNLMIGTVDGDIYYVRNGRVPIRPAGYDYKRAMPGNTSKAEWQGIHAFDELLQVHNPPQGYMQNCNISPQFLMKESGLEAVARAAVPVQRFHEPRRSLRPPAAPAGRHVPGAAARVRRR